MKFTSQQIREWCRVAGQEDKDAYEHIAIHMNKLWNEQMRYLRDDLLAYSTGASVLTEDLMLPWFERIDE